MTKIEIREGQNQKATAPEGNRYKTLWNLVL
jgi:hypothetical protein